MRVDTKQFDKLTKQLDKLAPESVKKAGAYFKRITPKDTGNARNKTKTKGTTIEANYGYAGRLDEGWSRQAPDGMSDPTIAQLTKIINQQVGKL
jgi:hypothetical protein